MSTKYPGGFITKSPTAPNGTTAPGIWTLEQAAYYTKQGLWPSPPPPSDPYFYDVSLLLTGNGTNGAQNNTFIDSSTNNITLTRNGNLTQGSFNPYGSLWSNYFNGTGNYLNISNSTTFDFGSGDFTIEAWVYPTNINSSTYLCGKGDGASASGSSFLFALNDGSGGAGKPNLGFYVGGADYYVTGSTALTNGVWTHLAVVRNGNTFTIYQNGTATGTTTNSGTLNTVNQPFTINSQKNGANPSYCYISNLRVVKGTAVYTSAFTPSTTPLTAISGTSLLTCQSNRFKDNSSNAFAITVNGSPQVQPFAPFNPTSSYDVTTTEGSGYFSTSSYLTYSGAQIGSNDFTWEAWFYPVAGGYGGGGQIFNNGGDNNGYFGFGVSLNGSYGFNTGWSSGSGWYSPSSSVTSAVINQWYHLAVTRSSGNIVMYLNGVNVGTGSFSNSKTGSENYIGYYTNHSSNYDSTYGYTAGMRLVIGSVVYTGNFTPPTTPPANVTNTALLPKFANAGIYDYATQNNLQTVGNAQVSTSVKKYGTGSIAFDGSSSQLSYPSSVFGAGDFTVESWVYFNSTSGDQTVFGINFNASANSVSAVRVDISGGVFRFMGSTDGTNFYFFQATSTSPSTSTWYHIALVRSSGTVTFYVNGTSAGSVSSVPNALYAGTGGSRIGSIVYSSSNYLNGYVDDFRITDGIARYTANFTPPTEAFYTF